MDFQLPPMEEIIANSFKDYHAKGFDYICLKRSPELTIKLYMFDGDVSKLGEVVNPHDHRYDFTTHCLSGKVTNYTFRESSHMEKCTNDQLFTRYRYYTKLNHHGGGFIREKEVFLKQIDAQVYKPGHQYHMKADGLHTINIHGNETVLILKQYEDVVPLGNPTNTYVRGQKPNLDGLYSRFKPDEIMDRFRKLNHLTGDTYTPA